MIGPQDPPAAGASRPGSVDWGAVTEAVRVALSGAPIVVPTDTVYGIAARPDDPRATERIFAAKGRDPSLALPVLAASIDQTRVVAVFDARAERIAARVWPGAVTLVLPRSQAAAGWNLGGDGETVGVRVPDHPLCRAVLDRTGPLAVTSANRSGEPVARTCEEAQAVFGDRVGVYLCDPGAAGEHPSAVVDLAHGEPVVLRAGAEDRVRLAGLLEER